MHTSTTDLIIVQVVALETEARERAISIAAHLLAVVRLQSTLIHICVQMYKIISRKQAHALLRYTQNLLEGSSFSFTSSYVTYYTFTVSGVIGNRLIAIPAGTHEAARTVEANLLAVVGRSGVTLVNIYKYITRYYGSPECRGRCL